VNPTNSSLPPAHPSRKAASEPPAVSIIVPNYNHARFLPKRIGSIFQQTFQDWELILLDDCSTDDSRSILSGYAADPRVRIAFNETNSGSTFKQWNKGMRHARGRYVWIAESDDFADERLLERLVAILAADPAVTFAYCQSWRVGDDNQRLGLADFYLDYLDSHRWKADFCVSGLEECEKYLVSSNTVPNASAVVFRRAVYEQVGGADENLRMCGDWKLWAAMALQGKVAYLGEPLNYFRTHASSVRTLSRRDALDAAEYLQVIRWILKQVTPTETVLKRLCSMQAYLWVPALMSTRVPWSLKSVILRNVWAVDPHPIRRAVRPAISTILGKLSRPGQPVRPVGTAAGT
jgi:glycosyltransferase involved in cell wall biosynthesis